MIDILLSVFDNYTRSLEILYLLNDIKKIVRLDANELELMKIREFCKDHGLHIEVSDFKVIKLMDKGKGGYSNIVKKVPVNYPGLGLFHIYISKEKDKAIFLKILENKNDDVGIGQLLGYPKCCIDFFDENKGKQKTIQNDYIMPALENSEGFEFPFHTNYCSRYFDVTLLSHFPHSFNCRESLAIALKNLQCLEKNSKKIHDKYINLLKGPFLYTENDGIFFFKEHIIDDNILNFKEILSTNNNELLKRLNEKRKIEIIDKNKVRVGDDILKDVGFMLFS